MASSIPASASVDLVAASAPAPLRQRRRAERFVLVGFAAVVVGGLVGSTLGVIAGFRRGWLDTVIMTVADAQLAFPFILLAIGIIAVLGPSFPTLIVVIGLSGWVSY